MTAPTETESPEVKPAPPVKPETITLPLALVQAVVDYLQERPYRETAALIHGILQHNPKT